MSEKFTSVVTGIAFGTVLSVFATLAIGGGVVSETEKATGMECDKLGRTMLDGVPYKCERMTAEAQR